MPSNTQPADAIRIDAPITILNLRWQLRHRRTNGLAACCVQIGKKLLISKSRYERRLATQAGRATA